MRTRADWPLTATQREIWLSQELIGVGHSIQVAELLDFEGPLDPDRFDRAVLLAFYEFDAFRTRFERHKDILVQVYDPAIDGDRRMVDLTHHADADAAAQRWIGDDLERPVDLTADRLCISVLFRLGDDRWAWYVRTHHLIWDAYCGLIYFRRFAEIYAALTVGRAPAPVAFATLPEVVAEEEAYRASEKFEDDRAFWQAQMADAPPAASLARRPAAGGTQQIRQPIVLSSDVAARLDSAAQQMRVPLSGLLFAAVAFYLARMTASDDVVLGMASPGRIGRRALTTPVPMINILPLRVRIDPEATFQDLVQRVAGSARALSRHARYRASDIARDLSRPANEPLFRIDVNYVSMPYDVELDGMPLRAKAVSTGIVPDVRFEFFRYSKDSPLELRAVFNAVCYEAGEAYAHAERWRDLLERLLTHPNQPLQSIPLRSSEDARLQARWNATEVALDDPIWLDRFELQAAETAGAQAVRCDGETLSYAALDGRANRLAHLLRIRGVGPDTIVGIGMSRSAGMMVALLGIMKAGGAFLPLQPGLPADRLRAMVADAQPGQIVTSGAAADALDGMAPLLRLDTPETHQALASMPGTAPDRDRLTPEHLAYVIYTSGSTGTPKGVAVHHRALANMLAFTAATLPLAPGERAAAVTSLAFDPVVLDCFAPLVQGATLVLCSDDTAHDPAHFVALMRREGPRLVVGTPSRWRTWLDHGIGPLLRDVHAIIGGEAVPVALAQELFETGASVWNQYGPTEATVYATCHKMKARPVGDIPIGRPVWNTRLHVLDGAREPLPVGAVGELYIGGLGVARGYLNRPELTLDRFIADPSGPSGARMYRTGDLVRWRADGQLEFVGRHDDQIKIRGYRIELGEVEAHLAACDGVYEAAVRAYADPSGDLGLAAFYTVVPNADEWQVTAAELRRTLLAVLPDYMVPTAYERLGTLPRTHAGKLDRAALPAPGPASRADRDHVPPEGDDERMVARIWQELLGLDQVGRDDSFFDLGGHSLMAVRMVARVREQLARPATLANAFAAPDLAAFVATLPAATGPAIVPVPRDGPLPASPAQRRLWFLAQLEGGSAAYHIPVALRLDGRLDEAALVQALDAVMRRQEALRLTVVDADGEPRLRVASPDTRMPFARQDLSSTRDAEAALATLLQREAARPFDLARGPLVRTLLVALGPDRHALLVTMHHIISDGWSVGVLLRELGTFYGPYAAGREPVLPGLAIGYVDHAAWQHLQLSGQARTALAEYWRGRLAGAPPRLDLPLDRPHPPRQDFTGGFVPVALDAALATRLRALGRRHGATLFMTVLAGFAAMLARLSGQEDIVIGTPGANRAAAHAEDLIGFFVSTLALRIDCAGDPSVATLLARVRQTVVEAQAHQDLPFEQVVDLVRPVRSLAHTPLFQVMFAWQEVADMRVVLPGLRAELQTVEMAAAKFDLTLELAEVGGGLEHNPTRRGHTSEEHARQTGAGALAGGFTYATALFERATVERFGAHLREVLTEMADGVQDVSALQIMPPAERALVAGWSDGGAARPIETPVQRRVERLAAAAPDAVAVAGVAATLTYGELDARADHLAGRLRVRGVRPEDRVALYLDGGPDAIVAILAVLKAGGAYVPVDPSYPAERVAFMLADSAPTVVLTSGILQAQLPGAVSAQVLAMDVEEANDPAAPPAVIALAPSSLAYVIYTSGSTGRPKGVMVEHRQLAAATGARLAHYPPGGSFLLLSSISFDSAVAGIFGTLAGGGRLFVAPAELMRDPAAIAALIRREAITTVLCTPSLARVIVENDDGHAPGLAQVILAGEPCPPDLARLFARWAPRARLHNEYGPTEATVWATVRHDLVPDGAPVTIGRPITGARIHILDVQGRPTPIGISGEIHVGGAGVARCYLHQPALSAQRFVADAIAGGRMYRTGDLGRWRVDGEIEYLGRNDDQIKLRGFRIEPGEIESRLTDCSGVAEAAVLLRSEGAPWLVAYVRSDGGTSPDGAALRAHLAATLPAHMLPSAFVTLERFPRSANGKLDRAALPAPISTDAPAAFALPEGRIEQELAAIWCDMLGVGRVGREDDFFALGGHSLLAAGLKARIDRTFRLVLPLAEIFEAPSLRRLAERIAACLDHAAQGRGGMAGAPLSNDASDAVEPLVAFRDGDATLPHLLLIHPVGGTVQCYAELVRHLPHAGPIWAVQQAEQFDSADIPDGIVGLARRYVAAWIASGNAGPMHLLGWSFGGIVAFEMALVLRRAGIAVPWLGMIDSFGDLAVPASDVPRHAVAVLAVEMGLGGLAAAAVGGAPIAGALQALADASRLEGRPVENSGDADLARRHRMVEANLHRLVNYKPSGPVPALTYFRATRHAPADQARGVEFWVAHATCFVVHAIDADHFTIVTGQGAAEIARVVAAALNEQDEMPACKQIEPATMHDSPGS